MILSTACLLIALAPAGTPTPADFTAGYTLTPQLPHPVQELELPDAIYASVLRADLSDMRVFNAGGMVVPHALCPPAVPPTPMPIDSEQPLPVFRLAAGKGKTLESGGGQVRVQTINGTQVQVIEPDLAAQGVAAGSPQDAGTAAYVIDAGQVSGSLRALRLNWQSADGASEASVRVEVSDDLDRWTTLIAQTTLVRGSGPDGSLERARIPLPVGNRYRYLRLERSDNGPQPRVDGVIAEVTTLPATPQAQPRIFSAAPAATPAEERGSFWFDSERLAPVELAYVELPMSNMALQMAIDSRARADAPWQTRWSGEVSSVTVANHADPGARRFGTTQDRYWRLRVLQGLETLGQARPALRLGYAPARLRFLTQGDPPYLLAYGSARAAPATPLGCEQVFGDLAPQNRTAGVAVADVAPAARFGGGAALTPLPPEPQPRPVRQIVLWIVLIVGALLLAAMSISLLRRLRQP